MRWCVQDEVNQEESEQDEVDETKKGADSTGKMCDVVTVMYWIRRCAGCKSLTSPCAVSTSVAEEAGSLYQQSVDVWSQWSVVLSTCSVSSIVMSTNKVWRKLPLRYFSVGFGLIIIFALRVPRHCTHDKIQTVACLFRIMELSFPRTSTIGGTFAPWYFRSHELSFPGTFVPWNFRSRERKLHGTFAPYNNMYRSLELSPPYQYN